MNTLKIDQLTYVYQKNTAPAVNNLSVQFEDGIIGLVGQNGAGKTTFERILSTLLTPSHGNVLWNGANIATNLQATRSQLGYLPQSFGIYPQLSGYEFLHYIGSLKGLKGGALCSAIEKALASVNLTEYAKWSMRRYSGGMARRIGIAQAILTEPKLLILDEPTVGLDPTEKIRFYETINLLKQDRIIIVSTHIISDIEAIADRIALFRQGSLVWYGTLSDLPAAAQNKVWKVTLPVKEYELNKGKWRISGMFREQDQMVIKIISQIQPHPNAQIVTPTVEDAYFVLC